jgi:tetratricopeptide (TPR) repeat protein
LKRQSVMVLGLVLVVVCGVRSADAETPRPQPAATEPSGLDAYLEARVLESNGLYREALDAYARSLEEAPDVVEVRVSYASLLVDLGMADKAVEILDPSLDLGSEGLRVRALALAQLAARDPEVLDSAEQAIRAAMEAEQYDPNLNLALAQVLQRMGRSEEAEELVAELREGLPENTRLMVLHAGLLRSLGRREEAVELYRDCASGGPAAPTCRENLVDLLVELDRPGEAGEAMLGWLRDIDLDSLMRAATLLWEGGRPQQSLDTVERVLAKAPDSERALALEAHLLSALGRHPEAVEQLRKLVKKNPNNLDLVLAMAWSTGGMGDLDESRRWLERGWSLVESGALSRDAVRCALTAARIELRAGNPMVAREWLDRVADLDAAGSDYVRLLAETFRREEQWKEGVAALVRIQPRLRARAQAEAEALEAEFLLRSGDERAWRRLRPLLDAQDAEEVLLGLQVLQVLERWPDVAREAAAASARLGENRDLTFTLAAALERLGRTEESEELFASLVAEWPDDADAANYLGYMWADRDVRLEEALDLIGRAVALDPENPAYLDSLGWVHYRLGDLAEAERWLRRAIDLGGAVGDGTILCHLGEVLLARGQEAEGRELLQTGLEQGCENPEHIRALLETKDARP